MEKLENLRPQRYSQNGTLLCGDVQALYKKEKEEYTVIGSYVHAIYRPLNDGAEIAQLKKEVPFLSEDYLGFLKKQNGLNAFSDSFCLYGFGRILSNGNFVLSRDPNVVLPYHLGDYNRGQKGICVVGTFCENKIVQEEETNHYVLLDNAPKAIAKWKNIESLITDCLDLLCDYYGADGKLKKPTVVGKLVFNKVTKIMKEKEK